MKNTAKVLTVMGYRDAFDPQTLQLHQQKSAVLRVRAIKKQVSRLARLIRRLVGFMQAARIQRNAIQALSKLNDDQLLDIGLSRSEVERLQLGHISLEELSRQRQDWQQRAQIRKHVSNIRKFSQYKQPQQAIESNQPLLSRCG